MANSEQSKGTSRGPEEIAKLIDTGFPEASRDLEAFRILKCVGGKAQAQLPIEARFTRGAA